jgi:hypothetical protein
MRLQVLHYIAKLLRIQFKVQGIPYGASLLTNCDQESSAIERMCSSTKPTLQ